MIPQCEENKEKNTIIEEIKNKKCIEIETYSTLTGTTMEWFQNYLILDGISPGIHIFQINLNGDFSSAIVIKSSNRWISFINFSCIRPVTQYNCQNGIWSAKEL